MPGVHGSEGIVATQAQTRHEYRHWSHGAKNSVACGIPLDRQERHHAELPMTVLRQVWKPACRAIDEIAYDSLSDRYGRHLSLHSPVCIL